MMKKIWIFLTALVLTFLLCACGAQDVPEMPEDTGSTAAPETEAPKNVALSSFCLIRAEDAEADTVRVAADIYADVSRREGGAGIQLLDDFLMPGKSADSSLPEILIGMTNRPESAEALAALPGYLDFSVGMVGEK